MPRSNEGDQNDVFFDSVDYLSAFGDSEYEIWTSEPQSISKRRESFMKMMGLTEFACSSTSEQNLEIESCGSERLTGSSGTVSTSGYSFSYDIEDDRSSYVFDKFEADQAAECVEKCDNSDAGKKKKKSWWKFFVNKKNGIMESRVSSEDRSGQNPKTPKKCRMKVRQNKKRFMELSALYYRQEIQAHKGFIWTMKFSPDGKYLATGGEDGVVRVWRVTSDYPYHEFSTSEGNFDEKVREKSRFLKKQSNYAPVVIPEKVFQIEETSIQEFSGHSSDALDLAWSNSNCLLSSSKDGTVRLWQVGFDQCLNVFHHPNYVTCVQFNPMDENCFISGSIDGRVRIWGVSGKRVVDWVDARDVITAICYQPDGKGFVVGSITGTCRVYESSGEQLELVAHINIQGRKKSSCRRITSIQFSLDNSQRFMVTSEDSKVRIFDGIDVIRKYKGHLKSGKQTSASFSPSGKHIISVGEDSRAYVWNYDGLHITSSKRPKTSQACEHFFSEGVSVAIPWLSKGTKRSLDSSNHQYLSQRQNHLEASSRVRGSERFSIGSWFSMEASYQGSVTWPEEKLPRWDIAVATDEVDVSKKDQNLEGSPEKLVPASETWGLVIVTAGWDGTIRTFHNYGLPVRV